jgi:enoyl-CoA hydratase
VSTELPESGFFDVELDEHVATVWLSRAEKLNALGMSAWRDLPEVMSALGGDDRIRAIVIAGRGTAFTAGIDLVEMGPLIAQGPDVAASAVANRRALYTEIKKMQRAFSAIAECSKPVIAAVHGYCIGAGIDLITACDIRLAAADAVFSVRETKLAMVADVGTMQRLPRIVDPGRAAELVFTGKDFDAAEASAMGLVSHVYADRKELLRNAAEMARDIAANSPLAVQGAKAILRSNEGRTVEEALDHTALWNTAFLHSNDLAEAIQAYLEKRPPDFRGE